MESCCKIHTTIYGDRAGIWHRDIGTSYEFVYETLYGDFNKNGSSAPIAVYSYYKKWSS